MGLSRDVARKEFVDKVIRRMSESAKNFDTFVLPRVFLLLLEKHLFSGGGALGKGDLPEVSSEQRHRASCCFSQELVNIRIFKRSTREEKRILLELLGRTTKEIVELYHAKLWEQEILRSTPHGVAPLLLPRPMTEVRRLRLVPNTGNTVNNASSS
jgi:hypothetical protein